MKRRKKKKINILDTEGVPIRMTKKLREFIIKADKEFFEDMEKRKAEQAKAWEKFKNIPLATAA